MRVDMSSQARHSANQASSAIPASGHLWPVAGRWRVRADVLFDSEVRVIAEGGCGSRLVRELASKRHGRSGAGSAFERHATRRRTSHEAAIRHPILLLLYQHRAQKGIE